MDVKKILSEMTVNEKAALVAGTDFMYTNPIPRLGLPSIRMSDGPHGLRVQVESGDNGISESLPATSFPTAATTASGWDPENLRKMGEAIGDECRSYGVHVLLGPGVNIKRNPLCGRNFEYFSEDPYLSGVLGAAMVEGVQSKGVGSCVKHFALNSSENYRFMGNSVAGENTVRRLYLRQFEYIVKHARPAAVMCAYNQINGTFCSENKWLLTDVLHDEWGYDGIVMTDWGAMRDRIASLRSGLDLEMPGDTAHCRRQIIDGVENGTLDIADLDRAVENVLRFVDKYAKPKDDSPIDFDAHHALAAEIAADSAVLMKNDGALPLGKTEKLHICGEMFSHMRYQGAGSSMINPARLTTPEDAFKSRGVEDHPVAECDKIVVFAGLTETYESEGCDRENMRLPCDQLALINEMCQTGKPVVVVLFGGSPVELPFDEKVAAILNMYLPGQNGGTAVYELLFGEKNPSGKLAETWPEKYEDVPSAETFGKGINEIYTEGTEVGYRYYNRHNIPVRYPFGHGLSYTTFSETEWVKDGGAYTKTVTNTGGRYGADVAMLFIDGELAGFEKVRLAPGESKRVTIVPEPTDDKVYPDELTIPDEPLRFPVTLESPFSDLKQSFMGRVFYNAVMSVAHKQMKKAKRMPDGPEKDNAIKGALFMERVMETNSLRSMSMSAGKLFPYNLAEGFVEMTNGHFFKGLGKIMTPIKVPKLPKEETTK